MKMSRTRVEPPPSPDSSDYSPRPASHLQPKAGDVKLPGDTKLAGDMKLTAEQLKAEHRKVRDKIEHEEVKIPERFRGEHDKLLKEIKNADPHSFVTSSWTVEKRMEEIKKLEKRNDDLRESIKLFMAGSKVQALSERPVEKKEEVMQRPKSKLETNENLGPSSDVAVGDGVVNKKDLLLSGELTSTRKLVPPIFVR